MVEMALLLEIKFFGLCFGRKILFQILVSSKHFD